MVAPARGFMCCRFILPLTLAGVLVALAPAWAGPARGSRAKSRPAVETSEQDSSLPDLVSDPKPLTAKTKPLAADGEPALPSAPHTGTGWGARGASDAPAPRPERVSALDIGGKLLAVVLCVYGLFTGVRLFKTGNLTWPRLPHADAPAAQLRLVESLPLGGTRRVYHVQAGGRTLLIGADASGLAALGEIPAPPQGPLAAPPPSDAAASPDDTNEIVPPLIHRTETRASLVSPLRPLGGRLHAPAELGGAQEQRGEEDWARKRDLLIRALKEKAVG